MFDVSSPRCSYLVSSVYLGQFLIILTETCVNWSLKIDKNIDLNDKRNLNEGRKFKLHKAIIGL